MKIYCARERDDLSILKRIEGKDFWLLIYLEGRETWIKIYEIEDGWCYGYTASEEYMRKVAGTGVGLDWIMCNPEAYMLEDIKVFRPVICKSSEEVRYMEGKE